MNKWFAPRAILALMPLVFAPAAPAGSVSAGSAHSVVVKTTDATAWSWGYNFYGQLGDTSTTQRVLPVQVSGLSGVVAVAAGREHTLALKSDGTVWAFGRNDRGQLGVDPATTPSSTTRVQVSVVANVVAIAAGESHSLAVTGTGDVYAWGYNGSGQLGYGPPDQAAHWTPQAVSGLTGVVAVAAGTSHSLALESGGAVKAWGANGFGQLGNGTTAPSSAPVAVSALSGATSIAAGGSHSLAVKVDGSITSAVAWGANGSGQLGNDSVTNSNVPVAVLDLSDVTAVSAGASHSVAVLSDGSVHAWGSNANGQLGDGSLNGSRVPGPVIGVGDAISVVAAWDHTLAVTSNGVVWVWGANGNGRLGDGTLENRLTPVAISLAGFEWKAGTPTFSPASALYNSTQNVTLSSATSGATMKYTTDGSEPTTSSTLYSGPVSITVSTTLKARAWKAGLPDSNVGTAVYELQALPPTFDPGAWTYNVPQNVTLSTTTAGATIYYTTNGDEPTESSSLYGAPLAVNVTQTLKARAFKAGWTASSPSSATYTLKVATPSFVPGQGTYTSEPNVSVSTTSPGATLRYTADGSEPDEDDLLVPVNGITLDSSVSLKAKGWRAGWTPSDTAAASYNLTLGAVAAPSLSPAPGTYAEAQEVRLQSATAGAAIHYTLDGSEPTSASPAYASPILVSFTQTLEARAFRADRAPSATTTGVYTITNAGAVAAPEPSLASGIYATARQVTVTCATPGATIHYTTDGTDPLSGSPPVPPGGLDVDRALVLKVRAFASGLDDSPVVRRDYLVTGAVSAGGSHSLALKADGSVWGWGYNFDGQVGNGNTTTPQPVPVQVSSLDGVVAISAGANHSLALKSDGGVWAWGNNTDGRLGDGTTTSPRTTPVQVTDLSDVVAIAAGDSHSLALKSLQSGGTVWAFGLNTNGQLGVNPASTPSSSTRVQVSVLSDVVAVAAGANHSLAIKREIDGRLTLWAWGLNGSGQLGDGTTTPRSTPTEVGLLSGVVAVDGGASFSLAVKSDGEVSGRAWTWGANDSGQLGAGSASTSSRTTPLGTRAGLASVAAGSHHALAASPDGLAWSWGNNAEGEVGDGTQTTTPRTRAGRVWGLGPVWAVTAGDWHSVALLADGRVRAWGYNLHRQLGADSTANVHTAPVAVRDSTPADLTLAGNAWLASDADGDGLVAAVEYRLGLDPLEADTNQDGVLDGVEWLLSRDPSLADSDGDGLLNVDEEQSGTDPHAADTDGDGVPDGLDAFPLDPTLSQAGPPDPNDHTPPLITLIEPPGAVVLP